MEKGSLGSETPTVNHRRSLPSWKRLRGPKLGSSLAKLSDHELPAFRARFLFILLFIFLSSRCFGLWFFSNRISRRRS